MRESLLFTLLLGLLIFAAEAGTRLHPVGGVEAAAPFQTTTDMVRTAFAHETITVSSTAIGFTAATYAPDPQTISHYAECSLEDNDIREWPDGGTPTASVGRTIVAGTRFTVYGQNNLRNWRAIRKTNNATLYCAYYR